MSKISNAKIEEMLVGLEGVTPGPWHMYGEPEVGMPHEPFSGSVGKGDMKPIYGDSSNLHHIARCDPDTIRSLISELQSLRSLSLNEREAVPLIDAMTDEEFNRDRSDENPNVGKLALSPDSLPLGGVKALEWHKSHMASWNEDWHTTSPFIYSIRCADENGWKWSTHGAFGYEPTPEAAKAAAQADFKTRISSALKPIEPEISEVQIAAARNSVIGCPLNDDQIRRLLSAALNGAVK